jgi:hypothetical protein
MCCNVDSKYLNVLLLPHTNKNLVLFSVLVLHWITAKDSAATHSPDNSADPKLPPSPTSKRLVPRPPLNDIPSSYQLSSDDTKKRPQLTTLVSASKDGFHDDEIDRIHTFPPNVITVEHGLVRQVSTRKTEKSYSEEQTDAGSEEDWCRKC